MCFKGEVTHIILLPGPEPYPHAWLGVSLQDQLPLSVLNPPFTFSRVMLSSQTPSFLLMVAPMTMGQVESCRVPARICMHDYLWVMYFTGKNHLYKYFQSVHRTKWSWHWAVFPQLKVKYNQKEQYFNFRDIILFYQELCMHKVSKYNTLAMRQSLLSNK